jgi:hypothetical protein
MQTLIERVIEDVTQGDQYAKEFLAAIFQFFHMLDDLYDRDKDLTPHQVAKTIYLCLHSLACNPFFQKHKESLLPVMMTSSIAWADSEHWQKKEGPLDRLAGQVLKSQYQDLFYLTASLIGGMEHAASICQKYRQYDYDKC